MMNMRIFWYYYRNCRFLRSWNSRIFFHKNLDKKAGACLGVLCRWDQVQVEMLADDLY
jgi:hypothetical protein